MRLVTGPGRGRSMDFAGKAGRMTVGVDGEEIDDRLVSVDG